MLVNLVYTLSIQDKAVCLSYIRDPWQAELQKVGNDIDNFEVTHNYPVFFQWQWKVLFHLLKSDDCIYSVQHNCEL